MGGTPATDTTDGNVVVINPHSLKIVRAFDIPATQCAGPQGMAIGPAPQILLGCNSASVAPGTGQNAGIMNEETGHLIQTLSGQGGNDEVWFNPGNGLYFLAEGSNTAQEQLGIVRSIPFPKTVQDVAIASPPGKGHANSVAADPINGEVYFPVPNNVDATNTTTPNPCPTPGSGCVAIYWAQYPQYSQRSH